RSAAASTTLIYTLSLHDALPISDYLFLSLVHLLDAEGNLHAQDLGAVEQALGVFLQAEDGRAVDRVVGPHALKGAATVVQGVGQDRKSTRLNSSHVKSSYAVFCL